MIARLKIWLIDLCFSIGSHDCNCSCKKEVKMPTYYVAQGFTLKHNGKVYTEGQAVEMKQQEADPKLAGPNKSLTKENWNKAAKSAAPVKKAAPSEKPE
jgi:hypothetical protein